MHLNQLILRGGGIERAGIHINVHAAANLYQRHIGLRREGDRRVPRSQAEVSFRIRGQALAIKNRKPGRGGGFVEVGMAKRGSEC